VGALRLAVVGAFPFPLSQGSQVYVRDQLGALQQLGAEITFFCYGTGEGNAPEDLDIVRVPRGLSPSALRAGPALGKPFADAALSGALRTAHRRRPFDVALAHNGEAALAALLARSAGGLPVVYVAHTLFEHELPTYCPTLLDRLARAAGRTLDSTIAGRVDAIIALCQNAKEALEPRARGPVSVIAPGLDPAASPERAQVDRVCERFGLERGRFALYTGNVDGYQGLDLLAEAARIAPEIAWVVATHGERRFGVTGVSCVRTTPEEARALGFGCGATLLPRRCPGGYPIKLLNYMETARPIIAFEDIADGLEHDRSAWLLPPDAGPKEFAGAVRTLHGDTERADRIGAAARSHLESHHGWHDLAVRTLRFCEDAARKPGNGVR
jgi:glycosyltransferase involved in cell wall biosynthesis